MGKYKRIEPEQPYLLQLKTELQQLSTSNPKYLSETELKPNHGFLLGKLNFVFAPAGSGKTTYVNSGKLRNQLGANSGKPTLFLAPLRSIVNQEAEARVATKEKKIKDLITWLQAQQGFDAETAPEIIATTLQTVLYNFEKYEEILTTLIPQFFGAVVIDEIDFLLFDIQKWEKRKNKSSPTYNTFISFMNKIAVKIPMVGITATREEVIRKISPWSEHGNFIQFKDKLRRLSPTLSDMPLYTDLFDLLEQDEDGGYDYINNIDLTPNSSTPLFFYIEHVKDMVALKEVLVQKGHKVGMIKSISASNHIYRMTDMDMEIYEGLISAKGAVPSHLGITAVIFNATFQRGISIHQKAAGLYISSYDPVVIEQVFSRFRYDNLKVVQRATPFYWNKYYEYKLKLTKQLWPSEDFAQLADRVMWRKHGRGRKEPFKNGAQLEVEWRRMEVLGSKLTVVDSATMPKPKVESKPQPKVETKRKVKPKVRFMENAQFKELETFLQTNGDFLSKVLDKSAVEQLIKEYNLRGSNRHHLSPLGLVKQMPFYTSYELIKIKKNRVVYYQFKKKEGK